MVSQTLELIERFVIEIKVPVYIDINGDHTKSWAGLYVNRKNLIYIDKDYWLTNKNEVGIKRVIHTLCHEVGHAVHFIYLANKPQYLERAYKGNRRYHCNLNSKESFAECFADYCFAIFEDKKDVIAKSKRLSKMGRILKTIINNGYKVLITNSSGEYATTDSTWFQYRNGHFNDYIVQKKELTLQNPFTNKMKQGFLENLINCRIDEIGLAWLCSDACIRAGYKYVSDFTTKEKLENIKVRKIGKRNLDTVVDTLRRCGIEGI